MKFNKKLFIQGGAEIIGTMILVFIGCSAMMLTDGNYLKTTEGHILITSLAFGMTYAAMYYTLHNISGAHFNPAVTFALWASKEISTLKMIVYTLCQMIGAVLGASFLQLLFKNATHNLLGNFNLGSTLINTANLGELKTSTYYVAFFMETLFAFIFVLVYLLAYKKNKHREFNGLVDGLAYTGVTISGILFTGGSFNPARSFGPAMIAMANGEFDPACQLWIYLIAPFVGALIAVVISAVLNVARDDKEEYK